MQMKQLPKIPSRSLWYFLLCSSGILLFVFIGLYPMQASLSRLDEDIALMKARTEEQKILCPLYRDLLLKAVKQNSELLLDSVKTPLLEDQVDSTTNLLRNIAQECGLEAVSVTPEAKSVAPSSKFMAVSLVLRGNYLKLRKFLLELEKLPFMEHMEELQIQEAFEGQEVRLKTWVAISYEKSKQP
jgi:hypothetical protein